MADPINVWRQCGACQGDGQVSENATDPEGNPLPGIPAVCIACGGSGKDAVFFLDESLSTLLEDIQTKVNDVSDKCDDILEKLNE